MALIQYSNITDGSPASANDINQRFGDILGQVNGNLDAQNIRSGSLTRELFAQDAILASWPVGSVYISVENVNPSSLFGGSWVRFAQGRTIIGVKGDDNDFKDVEKTGGKKNNTHTHWTGTSFDGGGRYQTRSGAMEGGRTRVIGDKYHSVVNAPQRRGQIREDSTYPETINIMNPYITVYLWKRIA